MDLSLKSRVRDQSNDDVYIKQEPMEVDGDVKPDITKIAINSATNFIKIKTEIFPQEDLQNTNQIPLENKRIPQEPANKCFIKVKNLEQLNQTSNFTAGPSSDLKSEPIKIVKARSKNNKKKVEPVIMKDPDVDLELLQPDVIAILDEGNGVMYSCNTCRVSSDTLKDFNVHGKIHENVDKPTYTKFYTCGVCMYACKKPQSLVNHRIQHKVKKYACDLCKYTTNRPCILKSHRLTHSSERPYSCDSCSFTTVQEKYLKYHQKKHCVNKDFKCDVCGKEFAYNKELKAHRVIHDEEKAFSCPLCDFQGRQHGALKNHMITHSDVKKYKCKLCDFSTKWQLAYKYHMSVHERKEMIECEVCNYKCLRLKDMKDHQTSHKPNSIMCEYCDYKCKKVSSMEKHMMRHFQEGKF